MIPNNLFHQIRKIFFPAVNQNIFVSFGSRRLNFPNNSRSDKSRNRINIKRVQRKNSFGFENLFLVLYIFTVNLSLGIASSYLF